MQRQKIKLTDDTIVHVCIPHSTGAGWSPHHEKYWKTIKLEYPFHVELNEDGDMLNSFLPSWVDWENGTDHLLSQDIDYKLVVVFSSQGPRPFGHSDDDQLIINFRSEEDMFKFLLSY